MKYIQMSPMYTEKIPIHKQKRPIYNPRSPTCTQKLRSYTRKSLEYTQKSPARLILRSLWWGQTLRGLTPEHNPAKNPATLEKPCKDGQKSTLLSKEIWPQGYEKSDAHILKRALRKPFGLPLPCGQISLLSRDDICPSWRCSSTIFRFCSFQSKNLCCGPFDVSALSGSVLFVLKLFCVDM